MDSKPPGPLGRFEPQKAFHVLLVDDDGLTLRCVEQTLIKCSYKVTTARNGREAIEILECRHGGPRVDLVLTDILMPEISGLELIEQVVQGEKWGNVPVIVMSSEESQSSVLEAFNAGASDYLIKPVRRNELTTLWQHVWRANRKPSEGASTALLPGSVEAEDDEEAGEALTADGAAAAADNKNSSGGSTSYAQEAQQITPEGSPALPANEGSPEPCPAAAGTAAAAASPRLQQVVMPPLPPQQPQPATAARPPRPSAPHHQTQQQQMSPQQLGGSVPPLFKPSPTQMAAAAAAASTPSGPTRSLTAATAGTSGTDLTQLPLGLRELAALGELRAEQANALLQHQQQANRQPQQHHHHGHHSHHQHHSHHHHDASAPRQAGGAPGVSGSAGGSLGALRHSDCSPFSAFNMLLPRGGVDLRGSAGASAAAPFGLLPPAAANFLHQQQPSLDTTGVSQSTRLAGSGGAGPSNHAESHFTGALGALPAVMAMGGVGPAAAMPEHMATFLHTFHQKLQELQLQQRQQQQQHYLQAQQQDTQSQSGADSGGSLVSSHHLAAVAPGLASSQRLAAVARYKEKRNNRNFMKKVRYESRKRLAESRPRVSGKFVKQGEPGFSPAVADEPSAKRQHGSHAGEGDQDMPQAAGPSGAVPAAAQQQQQQCQQQQLHITQMQQMQLQQQMQQLQQMQLQQMKMQQLPDGGAALQRVLA